MHYQKPEMVRLATAVEAIQNPSHIKGIDPYMDSDANDFRPTSGAYDADE